MGQFMQQPGGARRRREWSGVVVGVGNVEYEYDYEYEYE